MPNDETALVRHHIASQSRLCDDLPERVPTTLARELANHYPREVREHSERLASLAAELLRRERQNAADERAARHREAQALRNRVAQLQSDLTAAQQQCDELLHRIAANEFEARKVLDRIVERVGRFRRKSRASKGSLFADVTRLAESAFAVLAGRATE